jgi:integrase
MYLFRAPNCTYYTRICLPKNLRDRGFPFDLKISLLTKSGTVAIKRNFSVANAILLQIESITSDTGPNLFKECTDNAVDELRSKFDEVESVTLPIRANGKVAPKPMQIEAGGISLLEALELFIASKQKENVRPLTVKQLRQRTIHFINNVGVKGVSEVNSAHALIFRDLLLSQGRSHKTNKDYLAAVSQFFKWCRLMQYIKTNPFIDIKLKNKSNDGDDSARMRWQNNEIKSLLTATVYKEKSDEFKWVTLLMLYHGLRPSEACQLRVDDITQDSGYWCIKISDDGIEQRLKNSNSRRLVPLHHQLVKLGFPEFVINRKKNKAQQVFTYRPDNENEDWSREYCQKLGRLQTKIGMTPGQRPTAYSFRHTLIDELKQKEVDENIASQIVGHKIKGLTYGRYGKKYPIKLLAKKLNLVENSIEKHLKIFD